MYLFMMDLHEYSKCIISYVCINIYAHIYINTLLVNTYFSFICLYICILKKSKCFIKNTEVLFLILKLIHSL